MFNVALSQAQVQGIYNAGSAGKCTESCVTPPGGLTAWYKAEGNAGDQFNQHNGTLVNGTTFTSGVVGRAFSFDGMDDFIQVPHSPALSSTTGTWDFWVKTTQTGVGWAGIMSKADAAGSLNGVTVLLNSGGTIGRILGPERPDRRVDRFDRGQRRQVAPCGAQLPVGRHGKSVCRWLA